MKGLLRTTLLILTVLLLAGGSLAWSSQAVRVVEDLSNTQSTLSCQRQSNGTLLSVEIPAVEMKTVTVDSRQYQQVSLPGADKLFPSEAALEGEPDVPSLTSLVIIPDQAGVELSVSYSGYDTFEDIDIAPVQPSPSDNDPTAPIPFTRNQTTYTTDAFYPEKLAEAAEPVIMRDVRAVQVQLNAVQYNPVRREMRVYRDLSVSLSYGGEVVNPKLTRTTYLSDGFYPLYKATFANFEEFFSNMEVKRGGYMIICKAALADSLKALAMWKHQKGYSVRIVKTTEIYSTGSPSSTQIFNYIKNAYQTWADPPEYVMIVGDKDGSYIIPDYPYQSYPSDNKYGCVDGADFIPDIFVARLSVDAMAEFRIAVSKIFKYEKTPLMRDPEHWIRGVSVGYTMFNTARYTTLWVRSLALRHGFARVDTVYTSSTTPLVAQYMNTGPGLIWYRGEGGSDGWWGPSYYITDLDAMPNNQKLGVMSPLTCGLGDFGTECFGERWIRMGMNPDSLKGGPAFYGVSDHFTHTKWNNPIMVGYFFGIFEQDIYHFAAAAVAGKMQDYRTFPSYLTSYVQQYFNTYNMLGDPELEIRTAIPILLTVTHPDTIGFGLNHIEVNVIDTAGHAVSDAFVTLVKMVDTTEQVYSVGKTDAAGNVSLSFTAETPGNMVLTVSGRNLYPYQSDVAIVVNDIAVGFDSLAIDDDNNGVSHGNSDGLASPDETIELSVSLKNFGDSLTASNVTATLTPIDEGMVNVLDGTRTYGDLLPGESLTDGRPYVIHISKLAQDGELIRLKQTVTDQGGDSWYSVIEIPIHAPKFVISRVAVVDSINGRLDPGDTDKLLLTIINKGTSAAGAVTGTISTEDDFTTVLADLGNFGDMPVNDTSYNADSLLTVSIDPGAFSGRVVHFNLHTATAEGAESDIPFTVKVDSISHTYNPTGPDNYGYYMYDKNDTLFAPHPTYNWIELATGLGGQGVRLNFGSNTDDKSVLVQLPFNFVYYGSIYQKVIVCTNGFISPDTTKFDMGGNYWANFFNWPIPDPGNCRGQISPFWDDLSITSSGNYGVWTWNDTTAHRFVIEWANTTHRNTSAIETFEMVIYDPAYYPTITGDAEMLFQYKTISNNDVDENYASVGIESWDEQDGIQYTFDNRYAPGAATLSNTQALFITTNTGRGGLKGLVNLNNGGQNGGVRVSTPDGHFRMSDAGGDYWIRYMPPCTTSVTAEAAGYFPQTIDSVAVIANQTITELNFNPIQCPIPESLIASNGLPGLIAVNWHAVTNLHLVGYNLYRSRFQGGGFVRVNDALISTPSFSDVSVSDSSTYWYNVTAVYSESTWVGESFASVADAGSLTAQGTAGSDHAQIPGTYFLSQNYPNPFNPTTVISYGLPQDGQVKVEIFNVMGQKVRTLSNGFERAGYKSVVWDGKDTGGRAVASGVYFYRIDAGNFEQSKKMMMLK